MASAADTEVTLDPQRDRLVITASSLGTVFEWYDFFVYGILAALIGKLFFPGADQRGPSRWRRLGGGEPNPVHAQWDAYGCAVAFSFYH